MCFGIIFLGYQTSVTQDKFCGYTIVRISGRSACVAPLLTGSCFCFPESPPLLLHLRFASVAERVRGIRSTRTGPQVAPRIDAPNKHEGHHSDSLIAFPYFVVIFGH